MQVLQNQLGDARVVPQDPVHPVEFLRVPVGHDRTRQRKLLSEKLGVTMRSGLCVLACVISTSWPAHSLAQVADADRRAVYALSDRLAPHVQAEDQGSVGRAVGLGALLGGIGFLAGGAAGLAIANGCTSDEFCEVIGAFYGAAVGGTSAMALGVHLGNDRRGSFALDVLTGAAVWGLGIGIAAATDWNKPVTWTAFIGVPIGQLAATVAVERAVGR